MKYLVQCKYPDGSVSCGMYSDIRIIEMFGFRDCTDCEYEVYDVSRFGTVKKLIYKPATQAPFNYHEFCDTDGTVLLSGYSPEH